jgi:hypothetical protein
MNKSTSHNNGKKRRRAKPNPTISLRRLDRTIKVYQFAQKRGLTFEKALEELIRMGLTAIATMTTILVIGGNNRGIHSTEKALASLW